MEDRVKLVLTVLIISKDSSLLAASKGWRDEKGCCRSGEGALKGRRRDGEWAVRRGWKLERSEGAALSFNGYELTTLKEMDTMFYVFYTTMTQTSICIALISTMTTTVLPYDDFSTTTTFTSTVSTHVTTCLIHNTNSP